MFNKMSLFNNKKTTNIYTVQYLVQNSKQDHVFKLAPQCIRLPAIAITIVASLRSFLDFLPAVYQVEALPMLSSTS
jgi:hypothetical protein